MNGPVTIYEVFPVPTGMNRATVLCCYFNLSVPRAHGDEPDMVRYKKEPKSVFPVPTGMNRQASV